MREPRSKIESWRARVHPFLRRHRYRKSRREEEIKEIDDEENLIIFLATLGAKIAAGIIKKPKPGETIRVEYKK